jgi:dipeptide/tripeptide permease
MEKTMSQQGAGEVDKNAESYPSEKGDLVSSRGSQDLQVVDDWYEGKPTPEELETLRRVPGTLPWIAYTICFVEFAERASYYGVQSLLGNFINRPLPPGGNGYGAPPRGTQETGGALGMGTVKANAIGQSFNALVYILPLLFGYLADAKLGRFKVICWGIGVCGIAHVLMVASAAKPLLVAGHSQAPYFISLYMLAIGAGKLNDCQTIHVVKY